MKGSKDDIQCSMTIASKNLFAATNQINANPNGCGWKLTKTYMWLVFHYIPRLHLLSCSTIK
jgi:hypothetical protein